MKKIILLSVLFLILSCSNDNDIKTLEDFTSPETATLSLNISQVAYSTESCPEVEDPAFLIKDNSLVSGFIGQYGKLEESIDNSIVVYSCALSYNGNDDFVVQRFGGIFKTSDGESINLEAFVQINRSTQEMQGTITINNLSNNDKMMEHYNIEGNIKESGSCNIIG
jgi:hypothetical protein